MLRGRTPRKPAKIRQAVSTIVESLEDRRLLTTLRASSDQIATFDFLDEQLNFVHIEVSATHFVGEFLAARVNGFGQPIIRDLIPYRAIPDAAIDEDLGRSDGANLFNIYVSEASDDTRITITRFIEPPSGRVYQPYAASDLTYRYGNQDDNSFDPDGAGGVWIGAQTISDNDNFANIPITRVNNRGAYGVRPGNPRGIVAGIDTAPGISLNSILVGGLITGHVSISGSLDTFYAGNIYTGDIGLNPGTTGVSNSPNNFYVGGDLRNFLVNGSVGGSQEGGDTPLYSSGFQMRVIGKLGNARVQGDLLGSMNIINSPTNPFPINTPFHEIELSSVTTTTGPTPFILGQVDATNFRNDTLANALYGSSITSQTTGLTQTIEFTGVLGSYPTPTDTIDNYAVALLAGQKVAITLDDGDLGVDSVGVFDPYGRLVSSDFPDSSQEGQNQTFLFTAKVPGTYRLAVVAAGNAAYTGSTTVGADYTLRVENVGNLALGGLTTGGGEADGDIELGQNIGILVNNGDIGALNAGAHLLNLDGLSSITASRGNLRVIETGNIFGAKVTPNGLAYLPPDLYVPRGSVGYLHSLADMVLNASALDQDEEVVPLSQVGFDYQRVEVAGELGGNLIAKRVIGTITAGGMTGAIQGVGVGIPHIYANSDNTREDGRIDLIDVAGDFGSAGTGGPALRTGIGGNVKYVRVGGTAFPDRFFGTSLSTETQGLEGRAYTFNDDSGARVQIIPTLTSTTTNGVTTTTPGTLDFRTYGVRDSGGVCMIDVNSTTNFRIIALNSNGSFDIGTITANGAGTPVTYNAVRNQVGYTSATAVNPIPNPAIANKFEVAGKIPINILHLVGNDITHLSNLTTGEMVSVNATSLGYVNVQNFGKVGSSTASEVYINGNLGNTALPFNQFSTGIVTSGSMIRVASREAMGALYTSGAATAIGQVVPNSDGVNDRKKFEGIADVINSPFLINVNVGEGIGFGGRGAIFETGVFAGNELTQLVARNADIRGPVVSLGNIRDVFIENGSVIDTRIISVTTLDQAVYTNRSFLSPEVPTEPLGQGTPGASITGQLQTAYGISTIRMRGNGGMIGSVIICSDFKAIDISGGFGMINCAMVTTTSNNSNGSLTTDGLGFRNLYFSVGNSIDRISARGQGQRLNVLKYSPSVRLSENSRFDPFSGRKFSPSNDLHTAIGTSLSKPRITGITNSGIIENSSILGSDSLRQLDAFMIQANPINEVPITSPLYNSRIAFANVINKMNILSSTRGLQLTTGRLDSLSIGGHMEYTDVSVSGPIKLLAVGGNVRGTSRIYAKGPQGQLQTLIVKRALGAPVTSTLSIGNLTAGSILSEVATLNSITNLTVTGDVVSGAYIHATKNISNVNIGGDFQAGATIKAKLFGTKHIVGANLGNFVTA